MAKARKTTLTSVISKNISKTKSRKTLCSKVFRDF